jgi:hypothetical protein
MFVKKPSVALKSILRTVAGEKDSPALLVDLSILRDETWGRLFTTPVEVITRLPQIETVALSPDPSLPPGAPFLWLGHVRPIPTSSFPMISGQITPAIMQEALRRTPTHKAAGPDGVPSLVLKHMTRVFHEDTHLLFQALAIITPALTLNP